MSVSSVGASAYPAAQPSWSGQSGDGQVSGLNDRHLNNAANSAASDAANSAADSAANPLPPVQAATSPGTGQKVNVIA
jgi:hypothetical protein